MDFTIDTLIAMVVEELSEDLGKDSKRYWQISVSQRQGKPSR